MVEVKNSKTKFFVGFFSLFSTKEHIQISGLEVVLSDFQMSNHRPSLDFAEVELRLKIKTRISGNFGTLGKFEAKQPNRC